MKKIIIILVSTIVFTSCQKSNQKKAEDLIRKTMDAISQIDSNEECTNFEFGTLQKAQLDYEFTHPAQQLLKEMEHHAKAMEEKKTFIDKWIDIYPKGLNSDIEQMKKHISMVQLLGDSINNEKARFKPDTTRLMLDVSFQRYNKITKNRIQETGRFYFDKEITRIVGTLGPLNGNPIYIELQHSEHHDSTN